MKHTLIFLLIAFFYSCSDDTSHQLNGQWQLKTIEYPDGNTSRVDTIYYSFQKQTVFAFTHLINPEAASLSYGYLDFPSDSEVCISMDTQKDNEGNFINIINDFLEISGWNDYSQTFNIQKVNGSNLVLIHNDTIYSFKRF